MRLRVQTSLFLWLETHLGEPFLSCFVANTVGRLFSEFLQLIISDCIISAANDLSDHAPASAILVETLLGDHLSEGIPAWCLFETSLYCFLNLLPDRFQGYHP